MTKVKKITPPTPKPKTEVSLTVGKAGLNLIPFVGGSIAEMLDAIGGKRLRADQEAFFEDVADTVNLLCENFVDLSPEILGNNERFRKTFRQLYEISMTTDDRDKLDLLQAALANTLSNSIPSYKHDRNMRLLQQMSGIHIQALELVSNTNFAETQRRSIHDEDVSSFASGRYKTPKYKGPIYNDARSVFLDRFKDLPEADAKEIEADLFNFQVLTNSTNDKVEAFSKWNMRVFANRAGQEFIHFVQRPEFLRVSS